VSPDRKDDVSSWLRDCGADGVIAPDARENKELLETGLPAIVYRVARKRIPHLPVIIADNATIGRMAAEHLLERGFRHFAYCGLKNRPWSRERSESYTGRIRQAGLEPHVFYISSRLGSWRSFEGQQHGLTEWLKALPRPVGLMAGNDVCGSYVIEACRIAGLQVPDEVAVIGVDNDELVCDLTDPPMSSIALATQKAGYEAAELLDRLMAGEKMAGQNILVRATHIVTRPSTDILAIEDRTVAEAIRFIRRRAKKALQVTDVVDHVAMSRRNLELRFHRVLGRSIYSEIKRVRTEQIVRMLCETDLSISEIALKLGHVSDKHIARYFKQQTGMSLKEYRKQCRK
jgi:LacI family transcriptional regulator